MTKCCFIHVWMVGFFVCISTMACWTWYRICELKCLIRSTLTLLQNKINTANSIMFLFQCLLHSGNATDRWKIANFPMTYRTRNSHFRMINLERFQKAFGKKKEKKTAKLQKSNRKQINNLKWQRVANYLTKLPH